MFKWLVLVVSLYLLYRWIKAQKQIHQNRSTSAPPHAGPDGNASEPQVMVPCHHCKVYLPQAQAIGFDQRFYCCPEHINAIDEEGWVGFANWRHSPNQDNRPENAQIDLVVIHHISLPPGGFRQQNASHYIIDFFQNTLDSAAHPYFLEIAQQKVSSHFLITRAGDLIQFVSTRKRAWHAGASSFMERAQCNDFSIGIELEGDGETAFANDQYKTLCNLVHVLQVQHPQLCFAGHSDIAPLRKTDPGQFFDWQKFQQDARIPLKNLPFGIDRR